MDKIVTDLVQEGVTQSFEIPESMFGHTYHSLLIPPFPVKTALYLGWGMGTAAKLMDKVWPVGTEITGVDINDCPGQEPHKFFKNQAWQFVEWSESVYDFVVIDLYRGKHIPEFVFTEKFADGVAKITGKMLAINCTFYEFKDFKVYGKHFDPDCLKRISHFNGSEDRVMFMVPKDLK